VLCHLTFTNLKCGAIDKQFAEIKECYIKAVNRSHKYVNIHAKLLQIPVTNVTINLKVMRYDHGYKPFFVDITFDACRFLKNQKNPIVKVFYNIYKNSSNINHTCPFNHDFIVDHLWTGNIETDVTKYLPVISGDYSLDTKWYSGNVARAFCNVYVRITER
ncbi:hypothetical protein KR018_001056, partial [Drosophila ironensis]